MIRNTKDQWGSASKSFHWIFALLIAIQVPLGFWLTRERPLADISGDDELLLWLEFFHHSTGFIILFVAATRLSWRTFNVVPNLPAGMAALQRGAAKLVHYSLYVLMLVFPLSGWAASSLIGNEMFPVPINFWGLEMPEVPFIRTAPDPLNSFAFYREVHQWCWRIGGWILSLHVLAALYHQFIARDNTLGRFLPAFIRIP